MFFVVSGYFMLREVRLKITCENFSQLCCLIKNKPISLHRI